MKKELLTKQLKADLGAGMKVDSGLWLGQLRYTPQISKYVEKGTPKDQQKDAAGNLSMQCTFAEGKSFRIYESHPDWEMLKRYARAGRRLLFSFEGMSQNEGSSNQATQTGGEVSEKRTYTNFHDIHVLQIFAGEATEVDVEEGLEENSAEVMQVVIRESQGRTARRGAGAARDEIDKGFTEGTAPESGLEGL